MKKIFTLALTALALGWTSNVFAQEEVDMTSYIVNAGFDEDLTWQVDGSTKEIVSSDHALSTRSYAYVAEDKSIYAYGRGTRSDGRTPAWNGFFGQIKGWTIGDSEYTGKNYYPFGTDSPEWVYFGSFPYALGSTTIPCADDGTTFFVAPSTKPEEDNGVDNIGFLYLRAGWGGAATYKQVVKLECAQYRLEYWAINLNPSATNGTNLSRVVCRKDVFNDETGFTDTEWTKHSIEFTPTSEFTIEFGFQSSGGSGSNPYLCIDGIKLYKIGEADRSEILQSDLYDLGVELQEMMGEEPYSSYDGLIAEIEEKATAADEASNLEDLDKMEQIYKEIDAYLTKLQNLAVTLEEYENAIDEADTFFTEESAKDTPYPGFDTLGARLDAIRAAASNAGADDFATLIKDIQTAKNDYYMSQKATKDNPADYTFLVKSPYFTQTAANPSITFNEDEGIESVTYPNGESYVSGSAPADGSSEGWSIGVSGGDQRLNYINGRVCWNAWRTASTDVSISQELTDIPNGFYTISAEMLTQADYLSNQHIFANSTVESQDSPALTEGKFDDGTEDSWTYLTTEKVLVIDGKLTIGALGSAKTQDDGSLTTNQTGWFLVTNFRLQYYGEATPDEIATATAKKYADAQTIIDDLHLAKDKADLTDSIADAKANNDLEKVNRAIAIAEASEAEYNGIITGSYKTLQDNLAGEDYSADAKALAQVPVQYMTDYLGSAAATYTETGNITTILRAYLNNLIPALQSAEEKQKELTSTKGKAFIADAITYVKEKLATYTSDATVIDEQVKTLNDAIAAAELCDIEVVDGADLTAYIKNATINDGNATDWVFIKGNGDGSGAKSGQQYDGGSGYYLDSYKGNIYTTDEETGTEVLSNPLQVTWYQVLEVPNGTYTVSNIMRSAGRNAYLFVSDKAPVTNEANVETLDPTATTKLAEAVTKPTAAKYVLDSENYPVTEDQIMNDSYGEIWCAVADEFMEQAHVDGVQENISIWSAVSDELGGSAEFAPVGVDETKWNIFAANGGIGRGWFNNASEEIEVKDHVLVIGITSDYVFLNKDKEEAFTGTWLSADNFKLTLVKVGNNEGWDPTTGIADVEAPVAKISNAIFNIAGQQVDKSYKGIVITNGKKYLQK